jgi:hypothetical protein
MSEKYKSEISTINTKFNFTVTSYWNKFILITIFFFMLKINYLILIYKVF